MTRLLGVLLICSMASASWAASRAVAEDMDRDGIEDAVEQRMLDRFAPALMISGNECDFKPAEFARGTKDPVVVEKNGAVYGQMFRNGAHFEIHYYHLWSRDCGPAGHKLDVEHVSVLVDPETERALYWYAAAHEDTVCDASRGAKAADIDAEQRGAAVWISRAKHASYLTESGWGLGCGGDSIENPQLLPPRAVINIGELRAPMNGATWTSSDRWPLADKMDADFTEGRIARLADPDRTGVVAMNNAAPPFKAAVLGGNWGVKGAMIANTEASSHTGNAVVLAMKKAFGWLF